MFPEFHGFSSLSVNLWAFIHEVSGVFSQRGPSQSPSESATFLSELRVLLPLIVFALETPTTLARHHLSACFFFFNSIFDGGGGCTCEMKIALSLLVLVDVSDSFIFFCSGRGRGSPRRQEGGEGRFFIANTRGGLPGGGGGG